MSQAAKIRFGVIGTGGFAQDCHIPGLQSHPQAEVVALCGRRPDLTRRLADKFGIPDTFTDIEQLCARSDIDAVTIATANIAHAAQALSAFAHGKHVFCEKPLGMSVHETLEMTSAAEASRKVHQVAFTFRYNYGLRELRRRIAAGDIGEPFFARIQYDRWEGLTPGWTTSWREKKDVAGAGMLFQLGSHLFDITRHVLGPIESVIGFTHTVPRNAPNCVTGEMTSVETDDLVSAWFRNRAGLKGQFFISRVTPPFAQLGYLEIIGSSGALKAALSRGGVDFLKASKPDAPDWVDLPLPPEAGDKQPHALSLMMRSFVDACLRGAIDPAVDASFHDGLAAQKGMSALIVSEKSNCWTRLDQVD